MDVIMQWNLFAIAVSILLIYNMYEGYKKGMVREIISFISLVFLCVIAGLAGNGIKSFQSGKVLNVFVTAFLLAALGIAHHFIKVVVFPAKVISKLPVIHGLDKVLGIVIGFMETVLILWTVYMFMAIMDLGAVGAYIQKCTYEIPILKWIYENNQMIVWLQMLGAIISEQLHVAQ